MDIGVDFEMNWPLPLDTRTISNDERLKSLRSLLQSKRRIRLIEAHSPISAVLIENLSVDNGTEKSCFDGFWSSSLTDSISQGLPDIEVLTLAERLRNIDAIFSVTRKPLVFDGDTGGRVEHIGYKIEALERHGVSGIVIEDKRGNKRNSLSETDTAHCMEDSVTFCRKLRAAKASQATDEFLVVARLEGLIVGHGIEEVIAKALACCDAGADGLMVHSKQRHAGEVLTFAERFRKLNGTVPLVCVPTTYNGTTANELFDSGYNIVIYANHLLRAALKAMTHVAGEILLQGRTSEIEDRCLDLQQLIGLIGPRDPCGEGK